MPATKFIIDLIHRSSLRRRQTVEPLRKSPPRHTGETVGVWRLALAGALVGWPHLWILQFRLALGCAVRRAFQLGVALIDCRFVLRAHFWRVVDAGIKLFLALGAGHNPMAVL